MEGAMTRIIRAVAVAAGAVLALSVVPAALAADHAVDIAGFAFSPKTITVKVGDTVTWSNADAQGHTATADDGSFDTGTITSSTPKSASFATAGTFAYHCKIHPQMTGTVVVEAAAGGAGSSAPPTDTDLVRDGVPASPPWELLLLAALGGGLAAARRFRGAASRR
jgi:plastocyanin